MSQTIKKNKKKRIIEKNNIKKNINQRLGVRTKVKKNNKKIV